MAPTGVTVAPGICSIVFDRRHFSSSCHSSALFGSSVVLDSGSNRKKYDSQPEVTCSLNCRISDGGRSDEASTSGHGWIGSSRSVRQVSRRMVKVRAERDSSLGGAGEDVSVSSAFDEGKRLIALQKELLEQVTERKKLLTSLTQDFGTTQDNQTDGRTKDSGVPSGAWPPQSVKAPPQTPPRSSSPPSTLPSSMPTVTPDVQRRVRPPDLGTKQTELSTPFMKKMVDKVEEAPGVLKEVQVEKPPPLAGANVMNIIVVAAECAPFSKTGGLGDVVGALPKALARRGHRVMVVAPRYKNYAQAWETGIRKVYSVSGQDMEVGYFHAYIDGVDFVFIDSPMFHGWAHDIYGGSREDVLTRMILLCKAAVEVPWHVPCGGVCYGDGNLVLIANDWHTALLPVYLQAYYRDNQLMQYTRSVLVIHNIAHQGRGPLADFGKLGLPDHYRDKFALYDPIGGEHMNIFMAGIITAHRVIAVSHGYAWECQTQEGGWGLDNVIRDNSWKLKGVVNGIDDKEWNPELDPYLTAEEGYTNYTMETLETGKATCKAALQKELGLPQRPDVPLLGFIGRLDHQKGVDIIAEALPWMMGQDLQLVMLGTGRPDLEDMLRRFESNHRDKVRGWVGFSVKTAHRITAGIDILLMPSRFEPCGLNQLYAMKYGTVPVVHAVGGLRDTVTPFDPFSEEGLGWTFDRADSSCMIHAIGNAVWTFKDYKRSWKGIQLRGMAQDLSWDHAAQQYEEVLIAAKYQW